MVLGGRTRYNLIYRIRFISPVIRGSASHCKANHGYVLVDQSHCQRGIHDLTLYHHIPSPTHHLTHHFKVLSTQLPFQHFFPTTDMTDHSQSSRLHWQTLFEAAIHDYQNQTGISLADHPLSEQLQNCDSVESITAVLCEQTQAFNEFRGKDKVLKPLKKAVLILYSLSAVANFGQDLSVVCP